MRRYVDADALKANINTSFWSEIEKIIDSTPSIDIVRCKDCKHCHYEQEDDIYHCHKLFHRFYDTEHYCSYGVKETDHE